MRGRPHTGGGGPVRTSGWCGQIFFYRFGNIFLQVPPEYVSVAGEQYYISERPLSWSQAQYNCMSREGEDTHNIYKMHEDIYIDNRYF